MDQHLRTFEAHYDRHADGVFRHLYFRLGDRERAKELTQEVFMRLWQHLVSGKTIEHEKAFLYRIAHNLFINEIRTDKRTHSLDAMSEDAGFDPRDDHADTATEAEHQELLRHLSTLKESYRSVLIMRYIDGLAVGEIAELLGEGETNISMRIARGLEKLRAVYRHNERP